MDRPTVSLGHPFVQYLRRCMLEYGADTIGFPGNPRTFIPYRVRDLLGPRQIHVQGSRQHIEFRRGEKVVGRCTNQLFAPF